MPYSDLPPDLAATFDIVASAARDLQDPWWVFGGAAMVLAGLEDWHVPDVDVLTSPRDARRLIETLYGEIVADPGEGMFRSQVFGRILTTPVPIEVMAHMDVRGGGEWTPVTFQTRQAVVLDDHTIFTPTIVEQIETCRLFGRPKDLQRAERLETLIR